MPAHSVLISPAQGLPACCATATEPDSSSAVNIICPDRIPAILDSSMRFKEGFANPGGSDAHFLQKVGGCPNRSVPRHLRDSRPCSGAKIQGGPCKDDRWPYHIRTGLGKSGWAGNPVHPRLLARSSVLDQADAVGIDCGLPEQLYDIDWRKQIGDTAVTFCALSGAADPSSVR